MEPAIVDGNGTETGHIIVTTTGGRNGQPKQVYFNTHIILGILPSVNISLDSNVNLIHMIQTISYMAERVVGQGSFGVVFQVCF